MPYISQEDRTILHPIVDVTENIVGNRGISNGDLNYLFTKLAQVYLKRHGTSYNTISDVVKAFECAKMEFYARVARPYEDEKIKQNGDLY